MTAKKGRTELVERPKQQQNSSEKKDREKQAQTEDRTTQENKHLGAAAKHELPEMPRRPGYGKPAAQYTVVTNHFSLEMPGKLVVHKYQMQINKVGNMQLVPRGRARRVIELLISHLAPKCEAVSDFHEILITKGELEDSVYTILYRPEGATEIATEAPEYEITLSAPTCLNMDNLINYKTQSDMMMTLKTSQELLQALNISLGYVSRINPNTTTIGRNMRASKTTDTSMGDLGHGLRAQNAYALSARSATERVLVNIQVKAMPFIKSDPLEDLVLEFVSKKGLERGATEKRSAFIARWIHQTTGDTLGAFLRHVLVQVTYSGHNQMTADTIPGYKPIHNLAQQDDGAGLSKPPKVPAYGANASTVEFWWEHTEKRSVDKDGADNKSRSERVRAPSGGRYISVREYFELQHEYTGDGDYSVINVGSSDDPIYLPLDVCTIRAGQVSKADLSSNQTREMIKFAVRRPAKNQALIEGDGLNLLQLRKTGSGGGPAFGLNVAKYLLQVPARSLKAPEVSYLGRVTLRNAKWQIQGLKLGGATAVKSWTCLWIIRKDVQSAKMEQHDIQRFTSNLAQQLRSMGMVCPNATGCRLVLIDGTKIEEAATVKTALENVERSTSFLLVVLPDKDNAHIYNTVKYVCDVELGIKTQCAIHGKFIKEDNTSCNSNMGLKINLKLGGTNQVINTTAWAPLKPETTMFVGLDVTHPSPGSAQGAPSIASIVASINGKLAQWPAAVRVQAAKVEMIADLAELFQGRLDLWKTNNNDHLPTHIIVYRDGVSEGQYQAVLEKEVKAIQLAIKKRYKNPGVPRLAVIVVGKRHHTRFYPRQEAEGDTSGNLRNGLIVDRGVTNYWQWDFFLQAHTALGGTAKPAHYYVVYDEVFRICSKVPHSKDPARLLETITHDLCYLFGRATAAVSLCPPAYYADLACTRARCYRADLSSAGDNQIGASTVTSQPLSLHQHVQDSMFYI